MITVEKFLCFTLETGGLFIGWMSLVGCILAAVGCLIGLIQIAITNCDSNPTCSDGRLLFIGVFVFCIALFIGCAYIAWLCIQGTKTRNHFRIKPMMILTAIAAVGSILQIFRLAASASSPDSGTGSPIFSGIIGAIVNGYYFIVLYSLYSVFRMEYETGANRHQLEQPGKV